LLEAEPAFAPAVAGNEKEPEQRPPRLFQSACDDRLEPVAQTARNRSFSGKDAR
jgi:hypothetical protein